MRISRKILYSLVSSALVFALLETSASVWERVHEPPAAIMPLPRPGGGEDFERRIQAEAAARHVEIPMVEDETLGWKLPPHKTTLQGHVVCRINSDGLRGPEITPKPPGTIRLFTLGDSSIFGDSVAEKDVFSSVAATLLQKRWGVPVEAVIGAVPGHDSGQSLRTLEKLGSKVNPDWVIIGNIWSDLYAGNGAPRVAQSTIRYIRGPLRHLATYRVLMDWMTPFLRTRYVRWVTSREDVSTGGDDARVDLRHYAKNLESMVATARSLGAKPAFVMLPAPVDFDVAPVPETILQYREAMRQVARRANAPLLDGPKLFLEKKTGIVYFSDQVHPNTLGHRLLGEGLADILTPQGRAP